MADDLHAHKPDGKFPAFGSPPGRPGPAVTARAAVAGHRSTPAGGGQVLFDDGALRITRTTDGLLLAGELDEGSDAGLIAALIEVAEEPREIHVDLAAVQYCDLAGLRVFILASTDRQERPDHPSRCVILHHLPRVPEGRAADRRLGRHSRPGHRGPAAVVGRGLHRAAGATMATPP